jgi:putative salt-induced outer membrane protein YdiY
MYPRRRYLAWLCSAALAVMLSRDASAQVNTETLRKRIKLVGYSFILEGSLTGDTGNTEGIAVGGGAGGGWGRDPHLIFGYARFDYTKYADVTSVNKTFAHVRYNYEFKPWLWGEVFVQAQSDAFQRLNVRNLVGTGPRVRVLHDVVPKAFDVYCGTGYMFERDDISALVGATGPQNQTIQVWHRWNNYVAVAWEVDTRTTCATTFYLQPAFNAFADVRLLSETVLTFKVSKMFAAGVAGSVRYDSEPPTSVLPVDTEIKNTLTLTL